MPRLCLAAALATSSAVASTSDEATGARTPSWVFGNASCSATWITPRVALTTSYCGGMATQPGQSPRITLHQRTTDRAISGYVVNDPELGRAPGGGLLVVVLDQPSPALRGRPVRIPSYANEAWLLRDPSDSASRKRGTQLVAYGPAAAQWGTSGVIRHQGYHWVSGTERLQRMVLSVDMPLVYRSLKYTQRKEPSRFAAQTTASEAATPQDELGRMVSRAVGADRVERADDWLLPLAGITSDKLTLNPRPEASTAAPRVEFPFADADRGAGLMATAPRRGGAKLVGMVGESGPLHIRLVQHWAALYRVLNAQGLRGDAEHLARQVLSLKTWEQGGTALPGAIFGRRHPGTNELHFYRLLKLTEGGIYWNLPDDDTGNVWWQSLGTNLPSRDAILGWRASASAMSPAASASAASAPDALVTPPRGSAP